MTLTRKQFLLSLIGAPVVAKVAAGKPEPSGLVITEIDLEAKTVTLGNCVFTTDSAVPRNMIYIVGPGWVATIRNLELPDHL